MKLKTYILEIQNRLIIIIIALLICIITSYYYKETLLFLTVKNLTCLTKNNLFYFISTNITEIFTTYFKLIYLNSFFLIMNLILYHLLIFFKPALNYTEYSTIKNYFIKSTFFFYLYLLIFNIYLLPEIYSFFLDFQNLYSLKTINIYFENKMEEYIDFFLKIGFLLLIKSQFCILLFFFFRFYRK